MNWRSVLMASGLGSAHFAITSTCRPLKSIRAKSVLFSSHQEASKDASGARVFLAVRAMIAMTMTVTMVSQHKAHDINITLSTAQRSIINRDSER